MILSLNASIAQTKLSLKLTPGIVSQRITNDPGGNPIKGEAATNLSAAFLLDMPMSVNSFFVTGLGYTSKRMYLTLYDFYDEPEESNRYDLQYIQIPVMFRFYTSEVALDKRLYFLIGSLMEVLIHRKETNPETRIMDRIIPIDFPLYLGMGMEIQVGARTAIQIGVNYQRGLLNVRNVSLYGAPVIKNDIYAMEFAIKF